MLLVKGKRKIGESTSLFRTKRLIEKNESMIKSWEESKNKNDGYE